MKCISILILVLLVVVCKVSAKIQLQPRSKPSSPFSKHDETLEKLMLMRGGSVGSHDGDVDWRYFLAGGICAACSHGITTPLG